MKSWKRTVFGTEVFLDKVELWIASAVFFFFEKILVWFYEKILAIIFHILTSIILLILIVPVFIVIFPFSVGVSIFQFVQSLPDKPKKKEIVDLINKE